jgi:DNA-binding response OmpR family regulator
MMLRHDVGSRTSTTGHSAGGDRGPARVPDLTLRWPISIAQAQSRSVPGAVGEPHGVTVQMHPDPLEMLIAIGRTPPSAVLIPTDPVGADLLGLVEAITATTDVPVVVGLARHDGAAELAYGAVARGARGIVPLPCDGSRLSSAVRALGIRPGDEHDGVLEVGPLRLDAAAFRASVRGAEASLTPREFLVLQVLMQGAPRVVTAAELTRAIARNVDGNPMSTRTLVLRVRRKLDLASAGAGDLVETVRGVGYRIAKA